MSIGWHLEYWQDLAEGKLDAYGYIKVIQYLKHWRTVSCAVFCGGVEVW